MSYDEKKYRPGLGRLDFSEANRSHLYEVGKHVMDFGNPMCRYGWNRDGGESYSILRNNVGKKGICKLCISRAERGLPGVESPVLEEMVA